MTRKHLTDLILLISLLFLSEGFLSAQGEIDSLRRLLPNVEGKEKVDVLNGLASYLMTIDPLESERLVKEAYDLALNEAYQPGQVKSLLVAATLFSKRTNLSKSDSTLNLAIDLATKIDDQKGLAMAQLTLGALRTRQGRYAEAIENHFDGIDASRKLGDPDLELTHTMNIGLIKQRIGELEEAGKYLNKALEIGLAHEFQFRTGQVYLNLAVLEYKKQNIGLSIDFNKKALEIFQSEGDRYTAAQALNNLGFAYNLLGDTSKAMLFYDQSIELKKQFGDKIGVAMTLLNQAAIMRDNNQPEKSLELGLRSLEISKELNNFHVLSNSYQFLYEYYESRKQFSKALEFFKAYSVAQDSVAYKVNMARVKVLTTEFEFSKLENENKIQSQRNELNDLRVARRNLIILIISGLFIVAVFIFLWNRHTLKGKLIVSEKDNRILEQRAELNVLEVQSEKERLTQYADELLQRNKELESRRQALSEKISHNQEEKNEIDDLIKSLRNSILGEKDWAAFRLYFDVVYPKYFVRLKGEKQAELTLSEQRLACLMKIKLTAKEIADILAISPDSVLKSKTRLRQKLNFDSVKSLDEYLSSL